jgi:anti-sigma factor RsiW
MNGHGHLSEDVLLDAIYGIADAESQAHVQACSECAARLSDWRERACARMEASEISEEFLAAQRRKIYARIETQPLPMWRRLWWWAPTLAAAAALVAGVFVFETHRASSPASKPQISDAQLFNDIYSLERSPEPSATAPLRGLFEDQVQ